MRKEDIKNRAEFDRIASQYDRFRPGYPTQLFDDILRISSLQQGGKILEIGSGTGKATAGFINYNCEVYCIDISHSMNEVLKQKFKNSINVRSIVSSFEEWDSNGMTFDLIVAAQSFHWIPTEISYLKSESLLKEGGYIALFWNNSDPKKSEFEKELFKVYLKRVPRLISQKRPFGKYFVDSQTKEILESKLFNDVWSKYYSWTEEYSSETYINLLKTYSDHIALSEDLRYDLFSEIRSIFQKFGGIYNKRYLTHLFIAKKKSII